MSSRGQRRLIHSSDLHLDTLGDRRCQGLSHVVDLALAQGADLLVIAGDFFDHNRVHDDVVRFAVDELSRFGNGVVIAPGNHDCLVEDSVYNRAALWDCAENVRVVRDEDGELVTFAAHGFAVWGKPLMTYGEGPEPLAGMAPPENDGLWEVAVVHGYVLTEASRAWASFQITPEQLQTSRRDYVALGDSHAFSCVTGGPVHAYYSGAPSSGTHTAAIVDFDPDNGVSVTRHSLRSLYPQG